MKLEIKKYMSICVCVAFLLSVISINNIDTVKAQPAALMIPAFSINGSIFEDIGGDTYKNGLLFDGIIDPNDDWDPWFNPAGTEDDGSFLVPNEALVGVSVYFDDNPVPIATTMAPNGAWAAGPFATFFGKHYLTFRMDGYVTKTRNIDIYAPGFDCNGTFLERADAVIGRVTDTSGAPIIGARVIAYPRGTTAPWALASAVHDAFLPPGPPDGQHIIEGFTDRFGNYVLKGLQKGNYEIRVTREEYSPQFKTIYGINTDLGSKVLDFSLTLNPGKLEGFVRDMATNPIPNAIVSIPGLNLSATTDASGYYKIEQIPAGMYTVVAKAQGYGTEVYYYDDATNPAGGDPSGNFNPPNSFPPVYAQYIHAGQTETLSFQMDVASQECENDISGIVSNGAPIEYAEVEIPGLGLEITTDKAGYYIFIGVPCGTYWVVASDPEPDATGLLDHKSKKALVVCTIGQDIIQDFVLDENPCTIFGRVLQYDSDWIPVANATVEIPNSGISTTTDSFGYYVIENLPVKRWSWWDDVEGFAYKTTEYLLKVSKSGYFSTTEYVKPVPQTTVWQEFHIKKHTGILKGKVTEWDTDQGIADIKVTCAGRETYTDSNGFYEFVEVPIGSYTVHAEDYTWDLAGFPNYDNKAKISQQVTYGNVTIVDFRLPDDAAGKITGSVSGYIWYDWNASFGFSNEGEGVKDAEMTVSGKDSVFTDSYGYYVSIADTQDIYGQYDTLVIKAGPPGHVVTADAPGYFIAHSNVQTTVDMDVTDLSLGIPPTPLNIQINKLTGDLKGTVYDKDKNKPLPGHVVTVPLEGAPAGYVPFYDGVPASYTTAWALNITDALGTYLITGIPKGDHLVWEYATPLVPNYHDMFERVDIQSLINKNFGATRKIGRIEGSVWDDANDNSNFDPNETSLFEAVVKLSGKSTDPTSNDDNYSSIADSTGYYTILNVRITHDWDMFWNRYTGTAEYSGFYKEKWEYPIPPSPSTLRYLFDNNIEVWWADRRAFETTVPFLGWSFNYPLNKKDGTTPPAGGPDGLISGYVDLYLSLYGSNAEVWVQNTSYNVVSDIEGYYLVWNFGVAPPPPLGAIIVNNAPWGIPAGNYALRARALWYESDVYGLIETYDPEIYPSTVTVHSETPNINFDLSRKARGIEGEVHEDKTFTDIVGDLYLKNATVTIGNPDNGIGLPYWQKNTVDGGEYEFNDQQNGVLPINEVFLGLWYTLWYEKDSCWRTWTSIPVTWNVVTPLGVTTLFRWFGFIDGFVLDCDTYKPIVDADVNGTKQRTNPNPLMTNEVATYNYDATETPTIDNTDLEGYYLIECSVSTPKVHLDETEYTVNAAKTNYPAKCLNNITVEFNEINEDNDFELCKELGNTGVVLGIVYVDADISGTYDAGEEIGGVTVEIPGLEMTTISTTDTYTYTPLGVDYNFIFADVPLLPNGNDARYWLKFTHIDHEMAYGVFTTNTYNNWDYDNKGTEEDITDDDGNHIPCCGLQTVPDGWIEGLVYAPGSPNERLTDRDDNAKVWLPGAYRQCPTDDVGYYIIGQLAPYMPVGSTYPAIHTLVATANGYKPQPQRNVGLNSDTPWNHTWQDFSMELLTSMDYGILQGVVFFDGGIAVGDVGDLSGGDPVYDLDICNVAGDYDGPDPANPFEPDGAYDCIGTGENTVTEGIRNAVVTLNPTTTTDSYGYYILTDITSEMSHLVDVTVDLFQNAQHNVFIDSGWNTENFAMDAETGSISGRIYEDFDQDDVYDPLEEIENATVRAWLTPTPSFSISVFTEADGMYLMPLVPVPIITGSYTVHAEQVSGTPRYEPNEVDNVYVNPGVTTTDVDITLMRE
ncbi:MAG: carboxypeptidase regulatory-like domain-containing protein, partial [Methanomicrobia archaeon]|nr:carboxypeptidase regulatory-like domain-containing protein [Methanomicrobia archaeon]